MWLRFIPCAHSVSGDHCIWREPFPRNQNNISYIQGALQEVLGQSVNAPPSLGFLLHIALISNCRGSEQCFKEWHLDVGSTLNWGVLEWLPTIHFFLCYGSQSHELNVCSLADKFNHWEGTGSRRCQLSQWVNPLLIHSWVDYWEVGLLGRRRPQ